MELNLLRKIFISFFIITTLLWSCDNGIVSGSETADFKALNAAIASAATINANTPVNVSQAAKLTYTDAIADAQIVADHAGATQEEVDSAAAALAEETERFSIVIITIDTYDPGSD